jgi:hypothetical protein
MIVDGTHRRWIIASASLLAVSAAVYFAKTRDEPGRAVGGSLVGLSLGGLALGLMLGEALLALKQRRPGWRLGRGATWKKAHIWLGLPILPLVLLHAGFRVSGPSSTWLMGLLAMVWLSGIFGVLMQHFLPRWMTARLPLETIYEQIPEVVARLAREATECVENAQNEVLTAFFRQDVGPFLTQDAGNDHRLFDPARAPQVFARLKKLVPSEQQELLADLEDICAERAELRTQERMQRWLRGWLLVHVPLSYALLVLAAAHAVVTVLY